MAGEDAAVASGMTIPGFAIRELLQQSGPRVTYRAVRADGEPTLLKTLQAEYPRRRDVAELRREYDVLSRLELPGVIRARGLVSFGSGNVALELEDCGIPLAQRLATAGRPLSLDEFFPLALALARTLGALHERDVVHKDVVPRNILVDADGALRLCEFGICSELSRERQSAKLASRLEGSLPYISPEQTGRTSRDVDYRSDYYTFGVTCFELLTGTLPFSAADPLEWAHRHISQPPPLASERNPAVPEALARIVAKLMAKNAEDRYQGTFGLIADLERCRDALAAGAPLAPFPLGQDDVSRAFRIPQQLYGREREVDTLVALFDRVAQGESGFALVSGWSGVGKSALVAEMGRAIVRRRGYLVEGKFDQFQQAAAYGAIGAAFNGLVEQLLGEPAERLAQWRAELQRALGATARLVVDVVPALAHVLGETAPVPELPPAEAQVRFQLTFLNFVRAFAAAEHPLVLFMDDLQWSDIPTLNLLARLATSRETEQLLLIGAYRSNAVDATHPLMVTLDQVRKARPVVELSLEPLAPEAVERLVADTLRVSVADARPLSRLILEKAEGNPFFIRELLESLHEDGAITYAATAGRWTWDPDAVAAARVGASVVEFMVATLRRLPDETQEVLRLAACIGGSFDLRTLARIAGRPPAAVASALNAALARHMVVPLSDNYALVGHGDDESDAGAASPSYRFQHDRVQQAAYELIDAARKQEVHLSIGRLLLRHTQGAEREQRLIDIVSHLNAGRELITSTDERRELAGLNLEAGRTAMRSAAYDSALGFLRAGREMAGPSGWDDDHDLMLALTGAMQHCAYLTAAYDEADALADTILSRARTAIERAELLSTRTRQFATMGRMRDSIDAALAGLAELGIVVPPEPTAADVAAERARLEERLAGRPVASLLDAPEISDPAARLAVRLIMEVFAPSFLSGSGDLFPYLVLRNVNLALEHGASPEAAFAYGAYGMLLCGALDDHRLGAEYGRLSVAMNERFDDLALKSRIIYVYAMFVHHWSNHWATMTPLFRRGIEAGYQSGDMLYLAYSAQDCIIWDPALDLATAAEEQRKLLAIVKDCEYQDSYDSGTLFRQMQLNFLGRTSGETSMNDEEFNEERCLAGMRARGFVIGQSNYHIYKAEIHWLYGDPEGALQHVEAQDRIGGMAMSLPQLVRFCIVAFLVRAARADRLAPEERATVRARLEADLAQMTRWARNCADNFEHLRLTMTAELARLDGRTTEALADYERAIAAARASGFLRDEAVANELAARALQDLGLARAAEGYLRAARHLYEQWGARRKVEQLDRAWPGLFGGDGARRSAGSDAVSVESTALDMSSVIKASQTISGEIVVDQLLRTTLQILLENAGGSSGWFVVQEGSELVLRARAGGDEPAAALPMRELAEIERLLPVSMVNQVLRSGVPLVLADAAGSGRFDGDPYVSARRPKSVICVPIQRPGRFSGAIYLENELTTGAFTADRVEVLKLLAAQAAISVENAGLYEDQLRLTEAQGRFVPGQFLESLGHRDIARVGLGEFVAREMSVLFCDLRGFTPLAERLPPRDVIDLLNRHFSRIGAPIADAGGFIDSYNGDEVMALFSLPAARAVEAGIGMLRALERFNAELAEAGGPTLDMGIGVNTGPLVLGTVGSADRLKCGVVGDTVNTASRIEQLTKRYGVRFLIGEQTQRAVAASGRFALRPVDRVAAKGKVRAITLYEVLDAEPPDRRAAKEATRDLFDRATSLYVARDFAAALELLAEAQRIDPQDAVLHVLAARCERLRLQPPPADWDGAEALESK